MSASLNTEVVNLALGHLGVAKTVGDVETESSVEAQVARRFYEIAFEKVLRDYPWPFASKITAVSLVAEEPNSEWLYSYRYPSDCLHIRRVIGQSRNDTNDVRVPYKLGSDDSGILIYCDQENAEIEYTKAISDYNIMPSDFIMAFSFLLAHYLAPSITSGDPFKMGERSKNNYIEEISKAKASAVNEEQVDSLPESEFIRGRDT